ncbi:unnamed protein product [Cercopithifilaria johnstoni]|uniref:Uncharacterized protein n=1 Tax=Cercopithifilaria johnstoni TaxID=2874296 RepID=A0A8J2LST8_9BILA|nr:unnamed protein product [Cercopithifilaria johnstoni]
MAFGDGSDKLVPAANLSRWNTCRDDQFRSTYVVFLGLLYHTRSLHSWKEKMGEGGGYGVVIMLLRFGGHTTCYGMLPSCFSNM